jgi:hypothetical protein
MLTATQLYEDALTILDALSIAEEDFETASRLNSVIVELCILKRQSAKRSDKSELLSMLACSATGAPSFTGKV